jgi:hypothetical protein
MALTKLWVVEWKRPKNLSPKSVKRIYPIGLGRRDQLLDQAKLKGENIVVKGEIPQRSEVQS